MKAEISDAPERVVRRHHKRRFPSVAICLVIGGIVITGVLNLISRAPRIDAAIKTADSPYRGREELVQANEKPPGTDTVPLGLQAPSDVRLPVNTPRQTVFNDQNFIPRGADNIITLRKDISPISRKEISQKVKLTIVRQSFSAKERACWPLKHGSIEFRNCRASMGLRYRD